MSEGPIYDRIVAEIPRLRRFARNLIGSPDRADDLVQDALLRAVESIDGFRPGSNLRSWLFAILRNAFIDERRRAGRSPIEAGDPETMPEGMVGPSQDARVELDDLAGAIARLPEAMREALLLCAVEGMDYESAADILGVAVGTVRSRVSRARELLRQNG